MFSTGSYSADLDDEAVHKVIDLGTMAAPVADKTVVLGKDLRKHVSSPSDA